MRTASPRLEFPSRKPKFRVGNRSVTIRLEKGWERELPSKGPDLPSDTVGVSLTITWESIAKGPGGGAVRASTLAIMNGRDVTTQPRSGERIRIVVSGM